ncbi:uncharacterized protein CTHT_0009860 [Thermochaetoides thermophila DSM 1495]|uniref:Uncharacterized protein n=1 Tax=Chaetomium thermophilum (strain DSM 1495 / CBS 144.50 / IMI 039719) TaxID=759272 RepID=G0S0F7_CHATD|nr:hypothetical protein CTHT_0009860 [Thermochaetoides thermophila DSM 1495]EGS23318.1 hypothetical protein CTHT_0009860 [Thermochaetoides thermophila DSM 1495]
MSIARAFTTRRVKQSLESAGVERSNSTRGASSLRNKISSPIALTHTTNMLSYNAPDIHTLTSPSSTTTTSSPRPDDDFSDGVATSNSTPPTSPDIDSSPKSSKQSQPQQSAVPNHLSSYFTLSAQSPEATAKSAPTPPAIPRRSPSHTTKPYSGLSNGGTTLERQRSTSGMSQQSQRTASTKTSFSYSRSSSASTSTSATSHNSGIVAHHHVKFSGATTASTASSPLTPPTPPSHAPSFSAASSTLSSPTARHQPTFPQQQQQQQQQQEEENRGERHRYQHRKDSSNTTTGSLSSHPFGKELAQVTEIAEEYGVKEQVVKVSAITTSSSTSHSHGVVSVEADEQAMKAKGLRKCAPEEYLSDVRGLFASFFLGSVSSGAAAMLPPLISPPPATALPTPPLASRGGAHSPPQPVHHVPLPIAAGGETWI